MPDDTLDQVKALISGWPYIGAEARSWLSSLHWRQSRAVTLVYGQHLTWQQAAARRDI